MNLGKAGIAASILLVICLVLTVYISWGIFSGKAIAAEGIGQNTITVGGRGIIKVKPDVAYINVGVETRNANAKKAQQENSQIMDKVVDKLKSLGIKEDDIKTITYGLYPLQRYDEKTRKSYVYEYRANNTVEVTIRDIDKAGAIIDGVASVGSNLISNIRFGVASTEEYYRQALEAAVKNASGKAQAIAKGLGVSIKRVINVQEMSYGGPITIQRDMAKVMNEASMVETPISTGEMEIGASVTVQYSY